MYRYWNDKYKRINELFNFNFKVPAKFILLKVLRVIPFTSNLDIICKGIYLLDFRKIENNHSFLIQGNKNIKSQVLTYGDKDKTVAPKYIAEQKTGRIQPTSVVSKIALLDIKDSRFSLRNNRLIDPNDRVIGDGSFRFEEMGIYRSFLSKATHVKGTVVYLFDAAPHNYYHWMCLVLPKLDVYKKNINIEQVEFFYTGKLIKFSNFHRESLEKAGIGIEKIIMHGCTADRIVAAIHNNKEHSWPYTLTNKEYYRFTRNLFKNESAEHFLNRQYPKRIYVSRQNTYKRRISNINEVLGVLKRYGFETITMDGMTIQEQADLFSQAEVIIAPHGAALANLLFIQQQTKVIEILPYGYIDNVYYVLSSYAKAEYFYLIGEKPQMFTNFGEKNSIRNAIARRDSDIYVDIKKLDSLCKMALE